MSPIEQLRLLRRAPSFRALFAARLGSEFGSWIAAVALMVAVYDRTHSATWVSALLVAQFLPGAIAGLTLAPLVDRLPRRRFLIASDAANVVIFGVLPLIGGAAWLVALSFCSSLASSLFRPAVFAGLPNLVEPEDLSAANSLLALSETAANLGGAALAGALLTVIGSDSLFLVNAASYALSIAFLLRIPAMSLQSNEMLTRGHWHDLTEGFSFVWRTPVLRAILFSWGCAVFGFALINVGEIVLAKQDLHGGNFGYGVLLAVSGLGLTVGSLLGASVIDRFGLNRVYALSLIAMAVFFLAAALSPNIWVAASFAGLSGVANMTAMLSNTTLIQQAAPDALRGRVFSGLGSVVQILLGLGLLIAGPLTAATSGRVAWAAAAVVCVAASVIARVTAPTVAPDAPLAALEAPGK
jgi:MFS family permease